MSEEYSRTELNVALTQATLMLCQGDVAAAAQLYEQLLKEAREKVGELAMESSSSPSSSTN